MQQKYPLYCASSLSVFVSFLAQAQVSPDNTLPQNSAIVNQGDIIQINGGTEVNTNLFHSFEQFSLKEGQTAWFNNNLDIANIFSRVTGGSISDINGLIKANGSANLFLLNPNGIIFGESARLDIGGSFLATTADSLVFGDSLEFSATNPQAPPLLTVNIPLGLQYGSDNSQSAIASSGNLQVNEDLTLAANNLNLQGALQAGKNLTLEAKDSLVIRDSLDTPFIAASGNQLLAQGNNSVDIFTLNHPDSGFFSGGDMVLRSSNAIGGDAHYWSGGNFRIEKLDGSLGDLSSPYDPIIRSQGDVSFSLYQGSSLHILAGGSVDIGTVVITGIDTEADTINPTVTPTLANVTLSDGTSLVIDGNSRPTLDVRAGMAQDAIGDPLGTIGNTFPSDIFLNTSNNPISTIDNNLIATSADITIDLVFIDPSEGIVFLTNQYKPNLSLSDGDITISGSEFFSPRLGIWTSGGEDAGDVILDSRGSITIGGGVIALSVRGNGGNITILGDGDINFQRGVSIGSVGLLGGDIILKSKGDISVMGGDIISDSTNKTLNEPTPTGGDINIKAKSLSITNGAKLSAISSGQVNTGSVIVNASNIVSIDGVNSQISTEVPPITFGDAGNIEITTGSLSVTNGAKLRSENLGQGNTGSISINAKENVLLKQASRLISQVVSKGNSEGIEINTGSLEVTDGAQLDVSTFGDGNAGTVTIDAKNSVVFGGESINGQVSAVFSRVNEGAVGDSGGIKIDTNSLEIKDGATLSASIFGEGNAEAIRINAKDSVLFSGESSNKEPSAAFSQVQEGGKGTVRGIEINTNFLEIRGGAVLNSSTFGEGDAGAIKITAGEKIVLDGERSNRSASSLASRVERKGVGDSKGIEITTGSLEITNGASLSTTTRGQGNAGGIKITASDKVLLDGERSNGVASGVFSQVQATAIGNSEGIEITTGSLEITNGAVISTTTFGLGNAGAVKITASDKVLLDGERSGGKPTTIASTASSTEMGNSKGIEIETNSISITNGAQLTTSTRSKGNSGLIKIIADNNVLFDGESSLETPSAAFSQVHSKAEGNSEGIEIHTGSLSVTNGALLSTRTFGKGSAGNIKITGRNSVVFDGKRNNGRSSSADSEVRQGAVAKEPSNIEIQTRSLSLTNGAQVTTSTEGNGDAGSITVAANTFEATSGGQMRASTASGSEAGNINLEVKESITLAGEESGIFASTEFGSKGNGGSILTRNQIPQTITIKDGAAIAVSSQGSGEAGNLSLNAQEMILDRGTLSAETRTGDKGSITLNNLSSLRLLNGSQITTKATNEAKGGNITIGIDGDLTLDGNNNLISAQATEQADGGNVDIDADFIIAFPQNNDIVASAEQGDGGEITIRAESLFGIAERSSTPPNTTNDIDASSEFGFDGSISIETPDVDPTSGLVELPDVPIDVAGLLARNPCDIDRDKTAKSSSFIITGRGGLPPNPYEPLDSNDSDIFVDVQLPTEWRKKPTENSSVSSQVTEPIVEASDWIINEKGNVELVSQIPSKNVRCDGDDISNN